MNPVSNTGPRAGRIVLYAIALLAIARLVSLAWYPLMDTTEARYADIARRMLAQGDWVTPWFADGVPFWGKPPLSFWATRLGFMLFGVNEFGARLPHFLLGVGTAGLVWWQARSLSHRAAWHAVALLAGSMLFLVSTGAVMTDMALTLGNTLVMIGFWRSLHGDPLDKSASRRNGWLLALGAVVGLLAKGPVALVLWGLPVLVWAVWSGQVRLAWQRIAWVRGTVLVVALTLPWYMLAETRTPGFLQYFLVGEHWQRFVTPGWVGDLYGSAHKFPRGSIWLFAAGALLPWSLLLPLAAWGGLARRSATAPDAPPHPSGQRTYLLAWALAPCIFFTFAGNILWTYILPGLPAMALLAGGWTASRRRGRLAEGAIVLGLAIAVISLVVLLANGHLGARFDNKSAKNVVLAYQGRAAPGDPLYFLGKPPFSASFYSGGNARALGSIAELGALPNGQTAWVVLDARTWLALPPTQRSRLKVVLEQEQRILLRWN